MNFKKFIALALVVVMLLPLVSCGKSNDKGGDKKPTETGDETGEKPLEPTSKNIVGWLWSDDPEDPEISGFVRAYPDFTIDNTTRNAGVFDDHSQDMPKLLGAVASGNQPDLFWSWVSHTEAYYSGLFEPVQKYIDQDPDLKVEDFDETAVKLLSYDGQLYFLTNDYSAAMFVWNKDIFKKVGLDENTGPKTWDEFLEYCRKTAIYKTSGELEVIGFEQAHFDVNFWNAAYTGKHWVSEDGLTYYIDTPEMLKTLEFCKSIATTYGGNNKKGSGGLGWWFLFGNVAMAIWGGPYMEGINNGMGELPLPDENSERHLAGGVGPFFGIPKGAKNPIGGYIAMKYFCTEGVLESEIASYQNNVDVYIPRYCIHKPTAEKFDEYFLPLLKDEQLAKYEMRNELTAKADVPLYKSVIHTQFQSWWDTEIKKVFNEEITPKDFLKQAQQYADNLIAEFKANKEKEGWQFTENGAIPPKEQ